MLKLRVDGENPAPASEQLRKQVIDEVSSGRLAPGSKLPTVRRLAEDLGIAVNTAARAYRLLEADGIIETFGRRGTFVAGRGDPVEQRLQSAAADYARLAGSLGASPEDALGIVAAALRG